MNAKGRVGYERWTLYEYANTNFVYMWHSRGPVPFKRNARKYGR